MVSHSQAEGPTTTRQNEPDLQPEYHDNNNLGQRFTVACGIRGPLRQSFLCHDGVVRGRVQPVHHLGHRPELSL